MSRDRRAPLVHLELHTGDLAGAQALYTALCGWRCEDVRGGSGSQGYTALELGAVGGGIVECEAPRPLWLPYVEVDCIGEATGRARALGAELVVAPREGPSGWRSVIASPAGGELALWQPKR